MSELLVAIVAIVVAVVAIKVVVEILKNAALVAALITLGLIALGVAKFMHMI